MHGLISAQISFIALVTRLKPDKLMFKVISIPVDRCRECSLGNQCCILETKAVEEVEEEEEVGFGEDYYCLYLS